MARDCIEASDDKDINNEYHKFVLIRDIDNYSELSKNKYQFYNDIMQGKNNR